MSASTLEFRALRRFNGRIGSDKEWVVGKNVRVSENGDGFTHAVHINGVRCRENTLGQYTGLCDTDGNKIFCGDIVQNIGPAIEGDLPGEFIEMGEILVARKTPYGFALIRRSHFNPVSVNSPGHWAVISNHTFYNVAGQLTIEGNIHD